MRSMFTPISKQLSMWSEYSSDWDRWMIIENIADLNLDHNFYNLQINYNLLSVVL